jgi:hypothetical protein
MVPTVGLASEATLQGSDRRPRKRGSAPWFGLELTGQGKTDDFICRSVVRPEVRAIERQ